MSAILIAEFLVALSFAAAIGIIALIPIGGGSIFSQGAKSFCIAACSIYMVVAATELLASRGAPSFVHTIEESLELMFIPTVLFAVYSLLARQKIIDARRAHDELLRQSDMMIRIVESTPAGTMVLDAEGAIAFANQAARELLDLEDFEAPIKGAGPAWTIKMDLNRTGVLTEVRDWSVLVVPEPLTDVNVIVEWPNGWRRRLQLSSAPTWSPDGRLDGVVASFVDKEPWRAVSR
jgi:PAS domain-containing protein